MMISAIVGNESTNYNYACVSIEKLSDLCVCCTRLRESHRGMSVRIHARSMDSKTPNPRTIDRLQDSKSTHDRWIPRPQIHARSIDFKYLKYVLISNIVILKIITLTPLWKA